MVAETQFSLVNDTPRNPRTPHLFGPLPDLQKCTHSNTNGPNPPRTLNQMDDLGRFPGRLDFLIFGPARTRSYPSVPVRTRSYRSVPVRTRSDSFRTFKSALGHKWTQPPPNVVSTGRSGTFYGTVGCLDFTTVPGRFAARFGASFTHTIQNKKMHFFCPSGQ